MRSWLLLPAMCLVLLWAAAPAGAEAPGSSTPSTPSSDVLQRIGDDAVDDTAPERPEPSGYGWLLLQMVLVLGAVCMLAYVVLRWGVKRFVAPDQASGGMQVVSRLAVEPRRSILLVRVGARHLIIGSSEQGMTRLGELDEEEARRLADETEREAEDVRSFADILRLRPMPSTGSVDVDDEELPDESSPRESREANG